MNIATDRLFALIAAAAGGAGLVGPDQDDPSRWIGPKARAGTSDPMPIRATLGAQVIVSLTALRTFGGSTPGNETPGAGGGFAEFLDEYCGTLPPRPHVVGTITELAVFTAALQDGVFKSRLEEATTMLVERAFGARSSGR